MRIRKKKSLESAVDLLALADQTFIWEAYWSLLGRPAEADGIVSYTRAMRSGVSKEEILLQLKNSPEGVNAARQVIGLDKITRKVAISNLPVIGKILTWAARRSTVELVDQPAPSAVEMEDAEYAQIACSDMFSWEYYEHHYRDVADSRIDPLLHFVRYGWREGRNPSERFDTNFYLDQNSDVRTANINPLLHYIKFGKTENRKKLPSELLKDISSFKRILYSTPRAPTTQRVETIDILVPIYNGFEFLPPLFNSIVRNTLGSYRLVVVNDCSSDARVGDYLSKFVVDNPKLRTLILTNDENVGFIRSVNKAVSQIDNHFVILNSDTEVPPNWLDRLMAPILEMSSIASTTPFTNAGTICSFPMYLEDNPIFEDLSVEVIDRQFQMVRGRQNHLSIPTGIGFCMGINKVAVDQIGMFDVSFGKGYGEENDWCMRARAKGFTHLHISNLFVYHKHGGSFTSEEKTALVQKNLELLDIRYPLYKHEIQKTISEDAFSLIRQFMVVLISTHAFKTTVIFDNELTGGAHQHRVNLIEGIRSRDEALFLITSDFSKGAKVYLRFRFKHYRYDFAVANTDDVVDFLRANKVNEIIVNSFVSFKDIPTWINLVGKTKSQTGGHLTFLLHDYFAICPSYTLINADDIYCGVPSDIRICESCLRRSEGEFKQFELSSDISSWRQEWKAFLTMCDDIVSFSSASAEILVKAYGPSIKAKLHIRPHDITGRLKNIYKTKPNSANRASIRIGVLGAINIAKGSEIVRQLVKFIETNEVSVKVILIGQMNLTVVSPALDILGSYDIQDLERVVLEQDIDLFLVPSVWPETYSFTTDEIMQMGYPIIAFNLGAPAERVANYDLGKVINIDALHDTVVELQAEKKRRVS